MLLKKSNLLFLVSHFRSVVQRSVLLRYYNLFIKQNLLKCLVIYGSAKKTSAKETKLVLVFQKKVSRLICFVDNFLPLDSLFLENNIVTVFYFPTKKFVKFFIYWLKRSRCCECLNDFFTRRVSSSLQTQRMGIRESNFPNKGNLMAKRYLQGRGAQLFNRQLQSVSLPEVSLLLVRQDRKNSILSLDVLSYLGTIFSLSFLSKWYYLLMSPPRFGLKNVFVRLFIVFALLSSSEEVDLSFKFFLFVCCSVSFSSPFSSSFFNVFLRRPLLHLLFRISWYCLGMSQFLDVFVGFRWLMAHFGSFMTKDCTLLTHKLRHFNQQYVICLLELKLQSP